MRRDVGREDGLTDQRPQESIVNDDAVRDPIPGSYPPCDISGAQRWVDGFAAALGPDFRAAATSTHDATAEILGS